MAARADGSHLDVRPAPELDLRFGDLLLKDSSPLRLCKLGGGEHVRSIDAAPGASQGYYRVLGGRRGFGPPGRYLNAASMLSTHSGG